ncbi:Negative regulator of differentiation 1 [Dictyocoela roeselum]|nr:Negative regulator of differentiation 1 [Dictyocoela roeselum]
MNLIKRSLSIDTDIPLSQFLDTIKPIEAESCSQRDGQVIINFCDYISLYIVYKKLQQQGVRHLRVRHLPPVPPNLLSAFYSGANRSIYLTDLEEDMGEEFFLSIVSREAVESIKFFSDNKVVNIHFFSIEQCIANAKNVIEHPRLATKNKGFCKLKNIDKNIYTYDTKVRTAYIGNFDPKINPFDVLRLVKGGPIFALKVLREKKCGFITFLNPYAASVFIALCADEPLVVNGHRLKVTVGNNSIISTTSIYRIYEGSTRVIKIFGFKEDMLDICKGEDYEYERIGDSEDAIVYFLSINKAVEVVKYLVSKGIKVEYLDDPCGKEDYRDILIAMQQKEYEMHILNLRQ